MSWFMKHGVVEDAAGRILPDLSRRINTRRNRRRVWLSYHCIEVEQFYAEFQERFGNEADAAAGVHALANLRMGVSLKAYSAWSGIRLRKLSKLICQARRNEPCLALVRRAS